MLGSRVMLKESGKKRVLSLIKQLFSVPGTRLMISERGENNSHCRNSSLLLGSGAWMLSMLISLTEKRIRHDSVHTQRRTYARASMEN